MKQWKILNTHKKTLKQTGKDIEHTKKIKQWKNIENMRNHSKQLKRWVPLEDNEKHWNCCKPSKAYEGIAQAIEHIKPFENKSTERHRFGVFNVSDIQT